MIENNIQHPLENDLATHPAQRSETRETISNSAGLLLILTGPTAAGKTEVIFQILQRHPEIRKLVTTTTREPRPGEIDGIHYYFKTRKQFVQGLTDGEFLESTEYEGNLYGTSKAELEKVLEGQGLVFSMDISGALNFADNVNKVYGTETANAILDRTVTMFIGVRNLFALKQRFLGRGDDRATFLGRLRKDWSMWKGNEDRFPHIIINETNHINNTVSQVEQLMGMSS